MIIRVLIACALGLGATSNSTQTALFQGDDPKPGLVIQLDPNTTLKFSESPGNPKMLRWTISCAAKPKPGTGGVSTVSQDFGPSQEPSVYQWIPDTHTFWFGWRGIVQKETLILDDHAPFGVVRTDGGQWAVPRVECLDQVRGAPPRFLVQMKKLLVTSSR